MPAVGRIPPATGTEAIEEHHGAIRSQSIGEALHQDRLTHTARRMNNERQSGFTCEGCNVAKDVALNDDLYLGKRVRRGI
ncbi:hypothetical protein RHOFW510R12_14815 [Rhodanobacter sp. FW510-R12]